MSSGGNFSIGHFLDPLGITPVGKGKGGGAPNFWDPANIFTGGSKTNPQAAAIASAPVPIPAPPVTAGSAAVVQAEHDLMAQNLLKKSVKKTMLAGDTGGYMPGGFNAAGMTPMVSSYRRQGV